MFEEDVRSTICASKHFSGSPLSEKKESLMLYAMTQTFAIIVASAVIFLAPGKQLPTAQSTIHLPGVRYVEDPPNGRTVAIDGARTLGLRGRPEIPASSLEARQPLAIYTLSTADVAAGAAIDRAISSNSFYYAVLSNGKPVAGVNVNVTNGVLRVGQVNVSGPFLEAIAPAMDHLATLSQLKSDSYEARLLTLPGIFGSGVSQVIWLKADTQNGDLVFVEPQPFVPATIKTNQLYPAMEFMLLIQPGAQRRLNELATPPGGR